VTELVWETPLQIIRYPDPRLRAPNARIGVFDERLARLSRELFEVMYNGCAAPSASDTAFLNVLSSGQTLASSVRGVLHLATLNNGYASGQTRGNRSSERSCRCLHFDHLFVGLNARLYYLCCGLVLETLGTLWTVTVKQAARDALRDRAGTTSWAWQRRRSA